MARIVETEQRILPHGEPCRTAEQMLELCCEAVGELPCCEELVDHEWPGYSIEEIMKHLGIVLDADGRDQNGRLTEVRARMRRNHCGKKINRYLLDGRNCCDEATPLVWDWDASTDLLAPGQFGLVFVTGGIAPYRWKIRGQGFTFDGYSLRDAVTSQPFIRVHAGPSSCGFGPITVTDGCTAVSGGVRSTVGSWVTIGSGASYADAWPGVGSPYLCGGSIQSLYRTRHDVIRGDRALVYSGTATAPDDSVARNVEYNNYLAYPGGGCVGSPGVEVSAPHPADQSFSVVVLISAATAYPPYGYTAHGIGTQTRIMEWRC